MVALKEEKNGGGEIDLVRLFQILWKGKWIILVVALIFGIVAAIYESYDQDNPLSLP